MPPDYVLDVAQLRATATIEVIRTAFLVLLGLGLVLLAARRLSPRWVLAGVLAGNAALWAMATLPLDRLYALGCSSDRLNNLGFCQVVAAGNPFLQTSEVGKLHFEPFWPALMALLSGFNPERLPHLYAVMPLLIVLTFVVGLYLGLRPPSGGEADAVDAPWSAWERVCVAGFATLLCSAPLDYLSNFRTPWAYTFLLKPNHALGLAITPLFVWLYVRANTWRRQILAGLVLHLIGWAFVLHMAYLFVALGVLLLLATIRGDWIGLRRETRAVAIVIGVTAAIVSPYLVMLLVGYPFMVPSAVATIPRAVPHLLATTVQLGWVFWLGVWGLIVVWRRPGRLARVWEALLIGAYVVWLAYLPLSLIHRAREMDEVFYWIRFFMAGSAGLGTWDLMRRLSQWRDLSLTPRLRMALLGLVLAPVLMPRWWNPATMDAHFEGTLVPLPETVVQPTFFLRHHTDPHAVVASDPHFSQYVAALGARRVLFGWRMASPADAARRLRFQEDLLRGRLSDETRRLRRAWDIQYLLVTDSWLRREPPVTLDRLRARADLELVHLTGDTHGVFTAIFRVKEGGA